MDASASSKVHADINKVCGFYLDTHESELLAARQSQTVTKYTKLPDFDFDSRVSWPQADSYVLHPRLRRIVTVEDEDVISSHSLKNVAPLKIMSSTVNRRKVVTISEDDNTELHQKISKPKQPVKKLSRNLLNKSVETLKRPSQKLTIATRPPTKCKILDQRDRKETKPITLGTQSPRPKSGRKRDVSVVNQRLDCMRNVADRDSPRRSKSINNSPQTASLGRRVESPVKHPEPTKSRLLKHVNANTMLPRTKSASKPASPKPSSVKPRTFGSKNNSKGKPFSLDVKQKGTETDVIDVPLEAVDKSSTDPIELKDSCVETDPAPEKADRMTLTDSENIQKTINCQSQTVVTNDVFYDSLDIPNVTLLKDTPKEITNFNSQSLPNLNVPVHNVVSGKNETPSHDEKAMHKSASFIIGRATLTYTTRQKIDFHVVGQRGEMLPSLSSSPLAHPLNVVSVFRKEINKHSAISDGNNVDNTPKETDEPNVDQPTRSDPKQAKALDRSYSLNCGKLVKPSDVISSIRLDDGLMQNDFMCEQFQRELNFIDSFFESLQHLEICSLSGKGFTSNRVENWVRDSGFDVNNTAYDCLFPEIENGVDVDDTETIATKSLCLLNLLIRDEQRRAKNLLFVLKMREDALKDFTKSQILWLENKKKQDNTDISTLKKKQRGALLKLQHECGEMQRMRKALLALSEKRRLALLQTKNNIELKLNSSVDVSEILLGKKKIKRNTVAERNNTPLKCFDLSSSGCDEGVPARGASGAGAPVLSAEKSIQTGDSLLMDTVDRATDTAAESFVAVDGGYLNILFANLNLPQIFSSGKQYEVKEDALKNIVNSTNKNNLQEDIQLEKFIEQIKCRDLDWSSTPSTARSLVDEYDQYYKGLVEEDKTQTDDKSFHTNTPDCFGVSADTQTDDDMYECRRANMMASKATDTGKSDPRVCVSADALTSTSTAIVRHTNSPNGSLGEEPSREQQRLSVETQALRGMDSETTGVQAGPLPVPAGAEPEPEPGALQESHKTHAPFAESTVATSATEDGSSSSRLVGAPPLAATLSAAMVEPPPPAPAPAAAAPVHIEAEELRRQQLAIEREIKALEQQQNQLLVVREIPDKPPPPYTPPAEARAPLRPRMFVQDDTLQQRVREHILHPADTECVDPFDMFVKDFCLEMVDLEQADVSDKPWAASNLLPQKNQVNVQKLVTKTASELQDVLTVITTAPGAGGGGGGGGGRRSDHVDEILFAEWRRCEPAWTALQADEAQVKNQIFETIFQKVLSDAVDEYKLSVLNGAGEVSEHRPCDLQDNDVVADTSPSQPQ